METPSKRDLKSIGVITDSIQAIIAIGAVIVLALDSTGLLDLPWLQTRIGELTFIAVCALIVSSVLERRFTIQAMDRQFSTEFKKVQHQLRDVQAAVSGQVSADLFLKDRANYIRPIEVRIQNATEVCISGKSLFGFITLYRTLFEKRAQAGCIFRVVINDPSIFAPEIPSGDKAISEIRQTLNHITSLQDKLKNNTIQLRLTTEIISCSLLIIDGNSKFGEIQVEYYTNFTSTSDRPHIDLSLLRDPRWYNFYKEQFEALWANGEAK